MNRRGRMGPEITINATPEDSRGSGREISGLESKTERFSRLEEGRDYEIVAQNPAVVSKRPIQDFFIFINPGGGSEIKMINPPHWRAVSSSDIRAELLLDAGEGEERIPFYTANTKGAGYLKPTIKGGSLDDYDSWLIEDRSAEQASGYKVLGLSGEHEYLHGGIIEKSNFLATQGLRCEVYWGLAKLNQVYFRGELAPISALKRKNIILNRKSYIPEQGVRLFKTGDRVEEAYRSDEQRLALFESAFATFNQESRDRKLPFPEIKIGNKEHEQIYFREFFRRMGQNISVLLNTGLSHSYLHSSNVTMAAEIADIGTISHYSKDKEKFLTRVYGGVRRSHLKDMRDAAYDLRYLLKAGRAAALQSGAREDLASAFMGGFDESFGADKAREQKTDPTRAREWMSKIIETVIVRRDNLPSLSYHEVEDWNIEG